MTDKYKNIPSISLNFITEMVLHAYFLITSVLTYMTTASMKLFHNSSSHNRDRQLFNQTVSTGKEYPVVMAPTVSG